MTNALLLVDATVVDTVAGALVEHRDILIRDGRIESVTATGGALSDDLQVADAQVVDASGRFVIPGLVDMHAHPLNQRDPGDALALMLLYGVTGFRQMSGTDDLLERRARGELLLGHEAPGLLALCGPVLTPMNAATPDAAIAEVARQHALGADFIKMAAITPEVFLAVQGEATRLGIPLVGHLPNGMRVLDASDAGVRCIEHLGPGVAFEAASSADEDALLTESGAHAATIPAVKLPKLLAPLADRIVPRILARIVLNPLQRTKPAQIEAMRHAIDGFDEQRARGLARALAANGTWQCATLVRVKGQQLCADREFEDDPDLRFLGSATRDRWFAAAKKFRRAFSPDQQATFADQYREQLRLVKILDEEGVPMIAGTDAVGAVWVVPGASLHREFDELTAAGLSALRVLQLATIEPARFLGRDDLGQVAAGFAADLVMLEQDPLKDARNLRSIAGVIRAGAYLDPDALTALHTRLVRSGVQS